MPAETPTVNEQIIKSEVDFKHDMTAKLEAAAAPPAAVAPAAPEPPATTEAEPTSDDDSDLDDSAESDAEGDDEQLEDADHSDEEPADTAFDQEFTKALKAQGVNTSLDDVPKEARPIVERRLKEMERGFHAARQRDTARFADYDTLKADNEHFKAHTFDITVAELAKDPDLAQAFFAEYEALTATPRAVAVKEHDLKQLRDRRTQDMQAEREQETKQEQRAERITRDAQAAAKAAGISYTKGLDALIVNARTANPDLSRDDVKSITRDYAREIKGIARAQNRQRSADRVKAKLVNSKAGLVVKPGTGSPPAPGMAAKPTTDAEFKAQMLEKLAATG